MPVEVIHLTRQEYERLLLLEEKNKQLETSLFYTSNYRDRFKLPLSKIAYEGKAMSKKEIIAYANKVMDEWIAELY
jgi:hypothetical protein